MLRHIYFSSVYYKAKLVGFPGPALCFFLVPLSPGLGPLLLMTLGLGLHGLAYAGGFLFSHRDLAGPSLGGTLFGITNTAAQVPGFLIPWVATWLAPNVSSRRFPPSLVLHGKMTAYSPGF